MPLVETGEENRAVARWTDWEGTATKASVEASKAMESVRNNRLNSMLITIGDAGRFNEGLYNDQVCKVMVFHPDRC